MKVYLVGGAVRDKLLGRPIKERDWVVVGATPQEMLQRGFKKVGRDFPVFLHPETHEEYALARTERKTGKGYTDFICHADPKVSLEEDLQRRDLTINAMAEDLDGKIIDPYHGRRDLEQRMLRHVSLAFAEDPVRILRVARFAARYGDFKVHPKTNALMQQMLASGEVDALVPERVWQELEKALREQYPEKFFLVLKNCQVLPKLFSEVARHLPAIKKSLKSIVPLSKDSQVRLAAIAFNLEPKDITAFSKRYKIPNVYREVSLLTLKLKNEMSYAVKNTDDLISLLERTDAYRRPERLKQALLACQTSGKKLKRLTAQTQLAYHLTKKVKLTPIVVARQDQKNLKQLLHNRRKKQLEKKQ